MGSRPAELARELASRADWPWRGDVDEGVEGQGGVIPFDSVSKLKI